MTETVKGNPAHSSRIRSYMCVINLKSGEKGSSTEGLRHAEAMRLEDITQVMRWSEQQCPPLKLSGKPKDLDEMMHNVKHGLMWAFMMTGFVLWTRWVCLFQKCNGIFQSFHQYSGTLNLQDSNGNISHLTVTDQCPISAITLHTSRCFSKIVRAGKKRCHKKACFKVCY